MSVGGLREYTRIVSEAFLSFLKLIITFRSNLAFKPLAKYSIKLYVKTINCKMGGLFETISEFFFAKADIEFRLSVIGFPNAGKTTILQRLKFGTMH
jgi:hypothetical protein